MIQASARLAKLRELTCWENQLQSKYAGAGVAELADASDSKSEASHEACGFNSLLQHHSLNNLITFFLPHDSHAAARIRAEARQLYRIEAGTVLLAGRRNRCNSLAYD